ncbi:phage tail family protein [Streptomyces albulus]|nr:phage tail family protein [Streptomyces noursei]
MGNLLAVRETSILSWDEHGGPWKLHYGDSLIGGESPFIPVSIEGLNDITEIRTSDLNLAQINGEYPGRDFMSGRTITLTFKIPGNAGNGNFSQLVNEANRAFAYQEKEADVHSTTDHGILRGNIPGLAEGNDFRLACRVRKRAVLIDENYFAGAAEVVVELHASQPYLLIDEEQSGSVGERKESEGGVTFPADKSGVFFDYDKDHPENDGVQFEAGSSEGGDITCTNSGNADTWPTYAFHGPVTNPVITNADTGEFIKFNCTIAAGSKLVVDTLKRTVLLNGIGNRYQYTDVYSTWFPFKAGADTTIQYKTANTDWTRRLLKSPFGNDDTPNQTATCDVVWRSAWS